MEKHKLRDIIFTILFILFFLPVCLLQIPEVKMKRFSLIMKDTLSASAKEDPQQKAITAGDMVWVVKRNELGIPTSIEEHTVFAKNSDSIIVDETPTTDGTHSNNTAHYTALVSYPISDCYTSKDAAAAVLDATREN